MKPTHLLPLTIALLCSSLHLHANQSVYFDVSSFSYSESYTLEALFDGLEGEFEAGDNAFSFNKAEVGYRYNNWQISAFVRKDYYAEFTPDTALIFYQSKNDLPVSADKSYNIDLDLHMLQTRGIGLAYKFELTPDVSFTPRLNLLKATDLIDGQLNGNVITSDSDTYSSDLALEYSYGEDKLFDRPVNKPQDNGYSFDLDIDWRFSEVLTLHFKAQDLFAEIDWQAAPHTSATVNTDNVATDEDGFIDVSPVVSGTEGFRNYKQKLPERYQLTATYLWQENLLLSPELFVVEDLYFPRLHANWLFDKSQLKLTADLKAKALGVSYYGESCHVSLLTDDLDLSSSQTLGASFGCRLQF